MRTEGETAMVNDHTPPILQHDKFVDREALRRSGLGTPGPKIADGADADHPIRPGGLGQVAAVWMLRGMIRTLWVRTPNPMVVHGQPPTHLTSRSERSPVSLVTLDRRRRGRSRPRSVVHSAIPRRRGLDRRTRRLPIVGLAA